MSGGAIALVMCSRASHSVMKSVSIFLSAYLAIVPAMSHATERAVTLSVKPSRCVALQQGLSCFATLVFKWTTPESGDFCLYDERQQDPLLCWTGDSVQTYRQEFESATNVNFEIRLKSDNSSLAKTVVKISWVYKSNNSSTSRWRVF